MRRATSTATLAGWWAPGLTIAPHDHRLWLVAGVFTGTETNHFYRRTTTGITPTETRDLTTGHTITIGPDGIHAVTNPGDDWTGVVQVYGGDLFTTPRSRFDPHTHQEHPFDAPAPD